MALESTGWDLGNLDTSPSPSSFPSPVGFLTEKNTANKY